MAVLVQINKPRRDHQSAGMNNAPSAQGLGRNAANLSVADAGRCARHSCRFRIHDASEHEIELLC
ncbi:MAG TPA: hypothetical protein VK198_00930 [Terriglobales bacterium]|nr:hypothetical protein [Terriglobales bacterium]